LGIEVGRRTGGRSFLLAFGGQCGRKGMVDILKALAVLSRKLG